jgi:hypothetical protein
MTLASEAFDLFNKHQQKVTGLSPDITFWTWVRTYDTEYWKELATEKRNHKDKIAWRKNTLNDFNFNRAKDDTLNVRMTKDTADKIRNIAVKEETSVQEVCRVFIEKALYDYLARNERRETPTPHTKENKDGDN